MYAPVNLDGMLLGNATECAATISFPANLELAIGRAVTKTTETGNEWGGVVATEGKGAYRVWGPIEGTDRNVHVAESVPLTIPAQVERTQIGHYHTHPAKYTILSGGDIQEFLRWNDRFAVMTNCDGSVTTAVVSLGGEADKTATIRKNWNNLTYDGTFAHEYTTGMSEVAFAAYEHQLELFYENGLAKEAKQCRFCFYKREAKSGALGLVKYDDKMKRPTLPH